MNQFDAIIIGAGFGGLRALHELRELGLDALILEAGTCVGGTWYWNRYPGARTDSEAWCYCYSFSREIWNEWDWSERLPRQSEVLAYLDYVADRMDMRNDIQFGTRVTKADFLEADGLWRVETEQGSIFLCRYLISAGGILSVPLRPSFAGLENYQGEWYLTSRWPAEEVDLNGKKVAIVGSGATAVQVLPIAAQNAAQVTLFQRTPNYVIPTRNRTLESVEREALKAKYDELWSRVRNQVFAFAMPAAGRVADGHSVEQIEAILERGWEQGGFHFVFRTFDDLLVNEEVNAIASEFIRKKIRLIVDDQDLAEKLCPDYPLMSKRPPLGTEYYESFNKPNVSLIDISNEPISEILPNGIRVGADVTECDVIIFALGFDAGTGALCAIDIKGKGGLAIQEKWREGPQTYLGIMVDGFPNLFMISGPQSPFANIPPIIEGVVGWIGAAIRELKDHQSALMEPDPKSVAEWDALLDAYVDATVLRHGKDVGSWFLGANVEGKPVKTQFHFGGANTYFTQLDESVESRFQGFRFDELKRSA